MFEYPKIKPDVKPEFRKDGLPEGWCCGDAQKMLLELIRDINPSIIAEIGSFKGMSAYFMAKNAPNATVYCLDHWKGSPEHFKMGIDCSHLYETFIVNCWEYRDRINPVKASSMTGLRLLYYYGIVPEIIYTDGDHGYLPTYIDIKLAKRSFPNAVICGDDLTLDSVKRAVYDFAKEDNLEVTTYNDRVWRLK